METSHGMFNCHLEETEKEDGESEGEPPFMFVSTNFSLMGSMVSK